MEKCEQNSSNILELFANQEIVKICAPMVRYSKVQFRNLVKSYKCDLCFTPMILADSFCKSNKARNNEFTTNFCDTPLITQFAANTVHDFVGAAYLVSPYCNGVDLNCGCPQRWAKQQGLGCIMLEQPQLIYDLVRQCRNTITKPFTVSVKLRLRKERRKTIEICRQLENCGLSFLTVHGRTPDQSTGEIDEETLKLIAENVNLPLVANGGVKNLEECINLTKNINCKGVMVANAILKNPAIFTGVSITPTHCIQKWVNICYNTTLTQTQYNKVNSSNRIVEKPSNLTFQCFHHHLVFMMEKLLNREEKRIFNNLQNFDSVLRFLEDKYQIVPQLFDPDEFKKVCLFDVNYEGRDNIYNELKPAELERVDSFYDYSNSKGKFYINSIKEDCDWVKIFQENG